MIQDGCVQRTKGTITRGLTWVTNQMNCTKPASWRNSYVWQSSFSTADVIRASINELVLYIHIASRTYDHYCRTKAHKQMTSVGNCASLQLCFISLLQILRGLSPFHTIRIDERGAERTLKILLVFLLHCSLWFPDFCPYGSQSTHLKFSLIAIIPITFQWIRSCNDTVPQPGPYCKPHQLTLLYCQTFQTCHSLSSKCLFFTNCLFIL